MALNRLSRLSFFIPPAPAVKPQKGNRLLAERGRQAPAVLPGMLSLVFQFASSAVPARNGQGVLSGPWSNEPVPASKTPLKGAGEAAHAVSAVAPTNDLPIDAYFITSAQRYDQARIDLLASLGARSIRVSPVFAADGCVNNSPMQKSVKGILLAHKAAWDQIAATGRRSLILESDWGIGNQQVPQLRKSLMRAFERKDAYTSVGWCRPGATTDTWKFGCTTAYFINPNTARDLNASSACIAVDAMFGGLCKGRSGVAKKSGVNLHGKCCWWPGAAFPGYEKQMRGIFQQDRELYASTHAAADGDDSGAGFSGVAGKSVGAGQAKEGPPLNASQVKFLRNLHWGDLREPALCV